MKKSYFITKDGIENAAHVDRYATVYCEEGEDNVFALERAGFKHIRQLRYKNREKPLAGDIFFSRSKKLPVWDSEKLDVEVIEGRASKIKRLLGDFPKQQELADYLGVNKATVSGYPKVKKELMLYGLWVKKALGEI